MFTSRPNLFRDFFHDAQGKAGRAVVWVIGFFAFLNVYSMQAVLPLLMDTFHASPVAAGATVGATVLAIALVSPFIGMLSDAIGRKNVLCTSLFALSLPTALLPLAASLDQVLLLRFLQGLTIPGIAVVLIAYIAEEFRHGEVARMTAAYVGGTVMGGFCGRFITGHASHLLGWRGGFLVLAALNLGGALFALALLPRSQCFVANRDFASAFRSLRRHLDNRRLLAACAVGCCVLYSLVGSFTYVNLYLAAPPFSLSAAGLANVFCVYLVGVLATPPAARLIVRYGYQRALLAALAFSAAGLGLTLLSTLPVVIIGLTLCSTGVFIAQSATISFIGSSVSEGRSLATGLYYLSYYTGGALGSWLVGHAYEAGGWPRAVLAIAVVQVLAGALAWFVWRPASARPPAGEAHE